MTDGMTPGDMPPIPPQGEDGEKKKRKYIGKEYVIVSYFFVGIFVVLIGWMVYFNAVKSDEFINSPYNKRQNSFAERVIRGEILARGGEVLAQSSIDENGNETRVYPYGNVFAHTVGYHTNGNSGLESMANFDLLTSHSFILNRLINDFKNEKSIGDNVVTTLDVNLQNTAYQALGENNGAIVVLEAKTGKILAMVSKPDFDPNTLRDNWDTIVSDENSSVLVNRATQGQYPPGSTFKIVTALDYYRQHKTLDGFSYDCTGSIQPKDGQAIHCYDSYAHGQEDLSTAFANSCNCAFSQIGLDLGWKSLKNVSEDMLFNKRLPGVYDYKKSRFSLDRSATDALVMQTSMGQGETLTSPYHMALIVDAVANGGVLMKPYVVDHIENDKGDRVSGNSPSEYGELMTPEEAGVLKQLMTLVVENGTGGALRGLSVSVAGKTGSAEYMANGTMETHSWFVGFSNVEDPDLVVSVIVEGAGAGSAVAAPVARQILSSYYS